MKTIWIINQYAALPKECILGGRTHHLAREFTKMGHQVYVIGASWHHHLIGRAYTETAPDLDTSEGYNFVRLPVPYYANAHDKRRILNWFLFRTRLRRLERLIPHAPDAIYFSSPSLIPATGALRLARRYGARFGFEVRDIWPLTLSHIGGFSKNHPLIFYMQRIEDQMYSHCDLAVSPLSNAVEHMVGRGLDPAKYLNIPNGFSEAELGNPMALSSEIKQLIPKADFVLGYTGTIGAANKMSSLISATEILKDEQGIAFCIVGHGNEKAGLQDRACAAGLNNVHFLPPIDKRQVQSMLNHFDVGCLVWTDSDLYRYGISSNKLCDYMYAGLPILHSYSGWGDPVAAHNMGITVPAEDPNALAQAILDLRDMGADRRRQLGQNGRDAVLTGFEYGATAQTLAERLLPT